uniref:Glycine-rich protein n=1 Tax=Musa acuminata subsp. malaccensis TaxID=214687 RepID=A0A804IF49_MUSAM|nr:PREDICTED: glycine-rich cell wall structural protein 1 [Musa acuminata subsp. malaccensis]
MDWNGGGGGGEEKGLLWRLPVLKAKDLGKVGPGIGFGAGCGVGFGVGLVGGAGIGAGFPGLQLGFGFGAGCGIGLGFGYGVGRGVAYDDNRRYTNVGKLFHKVRNGSSENQIEILFDELMESTRKLIKATSKEIDKWR